MDCTHPLWSRTIKQKTTPRIARGGFLRLPVADGGRRPSGRPGKGSPVASPYSVGVEGCDWGRMDRGCRGSGDGGWNENEPSGGRDGRAFGAPLRRWGRGLWLGVDGSRMPWALTCRRDFDTNGVGVPRRGTLPGLRSGQTSKLAKIFCHVIIYKIII